MKKWDSTCARQHSFSKENQRPFRFSEVVQRIGLPFLIVFCSSTYLITGAVGYGDGPYYADEISMRLLVEPGHLLWRPLGAFIFWIMSSFGYTGDIFWILQALSFLGAVGTVLATYFFLARWVSPIVSLWGSAIVSFSNGVWFYTLSGSSYSVGLLFTLLALLAAIPPGDRRPTKFRAVVAGVFGGIAALCWLVYGLVFVVLLAALTISLTENRLNLPQKTACLGLFLLGYGITLGLPLLECYLLLPQLEPYLIKESPKVEGLFQWVASSSHGIESHFGVLQVLRWMLGWAQSVIALGDLGQSVKFLIVDRAEMRWSSLITGSILFMSFYSFVALCIYHLWRDRYVVSRAGYRSILLLGLCSFIFNSLFALYWDATALERYLPSLPFLVLTLCVAIELERDVLRRMVTMIVSLTVLIMVNWALTVYPIVNPESYKNQWLKAIGKHLTKDDLFIVLGPKKFSIVDPHNTEMPKIHNVSMQIFLHPPHKYKAILLKDIEDARNRGGQIFIGDSVLGLDRRPRDGWSFKEHPQPSPKDLDDFFSTMKGEFAFSVRGERVWKTK